MSETAFPYWLPWGHPETPIEAFDRTFAAMADLFNGHAFPFTPGGVPPIDHGGSCLICGEAYDPMFRSLGTGAESFPPCTRAAQPVKEMGVS